MTIISTIMKLGVALIRTLTYPRYIYINRFCPAIALLTIPVKAPLMATNRLHFFPKYRLIRSEVKAAIKLDTNGLVRNTSVNCLL